MTGRFIERSLLLIAFLFCSHLSISQIMHGGGDFRHEMGVHIGLEVPTGNLSYIYNPGPGLHAQYSYIKSRTDHFAIGSDVRIGYSNHEAKADTFYYLVDEKDYGTAEYSSYQLARFVLGLRFLHHWEKFEFYYGLEGGYYYQSYSYERKDKYSVSGQGSGVRGKGALGLKLGVNSMISPKVGVGIENHFHVYTMSGQEEKTYYTEEDSQIYSQYSLRLIIFYRIVPRQ